MNEIIQFFDSIDKIIIENYLIYIELYTIRKWADIFSISYLHLIWFIPSFLYFLIKFKEKRIEFICVLLGSILLTSFIIDIIKDVSLRPRPITFFDLQLAMKYNSFPSGHAGNSFTIAAAYSFYFKKFHYFVIGIAALICISRILNLKHYPSDIFVGAIIGILTGIFVRYLYNKIKKVAKSA